MALVNPKEIQEGLILHIQKILDGHLSEMPSVLGSQPSVIKDRVKAPRPNFPYVVVDRAANQKASGGGWLTEQTVDESDRVIYKSEQRLVVNITCYGADSDYILNLLRVSIVDDLIRWDLNTETKATFQYYTDISEKPQFIETDFVDGAEMDAIFLAISEWTPALGSSIIEQVEVNGSYEISEETTEVVITSNEN